jgi:hypothetical protein
MSKRWEDGMWKKYAGEGQDIDTTTPTEIVHITKDWAQENTRWASRPIKHCPKGEGEEGPCGSTCRANFCRDKAAHADYCSRLAADDQVTESVADLFEVTSAPACPQEPLTEEEKEEAEAEAIIANAEHDVAFNVAFQKCMSDLQEKQGEWSHAP